MLKLYNIMPPEREKVTIKRGKRERERERMSEREREIRGERVRAR